MRFARKIIIHLGYNRISYVMNTALLETTLEGIKHGKSSLNHDIGHSLQLSYLTYFNVLQGSAIVSINFVTYTLNNTALLILASDTIVLFKDKSEDFEMQCYLIDKPFASDIAYGLSTHLFSYLHYFPVLYLQNAERAQIEIWETQCQYMLTQYKRYQKKMLCNHFQNLFLAISEHVYHIDIKENNRFSKKEDLCWRFWELIGKHAKTHRDVTFYATLLCITPYYLSQITKYFLNEAPKDLINRQVILEIKVLLISKNKSINEIADELHFEDPSYMGKYFKRETGLSLTDFRKA